MTAIKHSRQRDAIRDNLRSRFDHPTADMIYSDIRKQYPNIRLICLSMGPDGSRAYYEDVRVEVPAFLQEGTIETTGAGDTFGACVMNGSLQSGLDGLDEPKLKEILTFANAAASIVTTRKGALRVMPQKDEVLAFLKANQ